MPKGFHIILLYKVVKQKGAALPLSRKEHKSSHRDEIEKTKTKRNGKFSFGKTFLLYPKFTMLIFSILRIILENYANCQ